MMERLKIACGLLGFIAWMWWCIAWMEDELEFKNFRKRRKNKEA